MEAPICIDYDEEWLWAQQARRDAAVAEFGPGSDAVRRIDQELAEGEAALRRASALHQEAAQRDVVVQHPADVV